MSVSRMKSTSDKNKVIYSMLYYISSLYNVYITFCVGANVHISTNIDAEVNFFFFSSPYHEVLFETLTQADEKVERSLW